jgi:diguanylate cyclase (GGDEF)-like protein
VLLWIGLLYALLGALRPSFAPGRPGLVLLVVDELLAVLLVGTWVACRRPAVRSWVQQRAQGVGLALCLLATVDLAGGLATLGHPGQAGGCMILMMITAALLQHRRYAATVVGVCLAQWFVLAGSQGLRGEWGLVSIMVVVAAVIAGVLHASRRRTADQLVQAQDAIRVAAVTDEMTGLTNRRGLLEAARDRLDPSCAAGPVSILLLDVDGLKAVNDLHGHDGGDRLLVSTATALRAATRPGDVVARLGGDEFAVLLDGTSAEQAAVVRDKVDRALREVGATASIGVAQAAPGWSVERLLADADADMYVIKRLRRGGATRATGPGGWAGAVARPGPVPAAGPGWQQPPDPAEADMRGLCVTGAWVHLGLAPLHLLMAPPSAAVELAVLSLLLAVLLAGVAAAHAWHRTRALLRDHAALLITATLTVVCAETLLYALVVGEVWTTTAVIAAVVPTAALIRSWRCAALVSVGTALAWALLVVGGALRGDWTVYAMNMATAPVIGLLLHSIGSRTIRRLTAAQAQVRAAALTDELTGLTNRRGFLSAGRQHLDAVAGQGGAGLLFLDLDGLKAVNDTDGHAAGDRLIAAAADVLLRTLEPRELCARYGGDEFTLLLGGQGRAHAAQRSRALEDAMSAAGVQVSIGTALLGAGDTIEALVARADHEMYRRRADARSAIGAAPVKIMPPLADPPLCAPSGCLDEAPPALVQGTTGT